MQNYSVKISNAVQNALCSLLLYVSAFYKNCTYTYKTPHAFVLCVLLGVKSDETTCHTLDIRTVSVQCELCCERELDWAF